MLRNKSYVWWSFSQALPNELECCPKQCRCCYWWIFKSNSSLHLFNDWYLDSGNFNAHWCGFMRFGAIRPKWRPSNEIGANSFRLYYGHLWLARKRLVRAIQCTQFCAKCAKNDLKPTGFLKCNSYFEMKGVWSCLQWHPSKRKSSFSKHPLAKNGTSSGWYNGP